MKKATLQSVARDVRAIARSVAAMNKPGKQPPAAANLDRDEVDVGMTIFDGQPMRLILLTDKIDWIEPAPWAECMAAAKKGLKWKPEYSLPTRIDGLVLFARAKERFKTDLPYWTCEEYAGLRNFAWTQWFGSGDQVTWLKDGKYRACLVRRLPI